MRTLIAAFALAATPALAAGERFVSLDNTDFIVLLAFLLFVGILIYFQVPQRLAGMLDDRATQIRADLDEARGIREEAQTLLASYERKAREVSAQSERIVAQARAEAEAAAEAARADLDRTIQRRIAAAEEQIASAEAAAVREVRNRAVEVATAAAAQVLAAQMSDEARGALIDDGIGIVDRRLN